MKINALIQANNTETTQITIADENTIVVGNETTDLSPIPNGGMADGDGNIIGNVFKDGDGVNSLSVIVKYVPETTNWNGQALKMLQVDVFPAMIGIDDFFDGAV